MNQFAESPLDDASALEWLAFRYVADELTELEREAFEARLADDQAAREAVAAAVDLTQAVAWVEHESTAIARPAAAPTRPQRERTRRWTIALGWMLAGSAACLAGLALVNRFRDESSDRLLDSAAMHASDEPRQLALAWSQTRRDAEFADETDALSAVESLGRGRIDEEAASADETATEEATSDEEDEASTEDPMAAMSRQTPSWIMAAVSDNGSETKAP